MGHYSDPICSPHMDAATTEPPGLWRHAARRGPVDPPGAVALGRVRTGGRPAGQAARGTDTETQRESQRPGVTCRGGVWSL